MTVINTVINQIGLGRSQNAKLMSISENLLKSSRTFLLKKRALLRTVQFCLKFNIIMLCYLCYFASYVHSYVNVCCYGGFSYFQEKVQNYLINFRLK